jgi:hypothetical protein
MMYFICCTLLSMCVYMMIGIILTAVLLKIFPPHRGVVTFQGVLFSAACWPIYPSSVDVKDSASKET